MTHHAAAILISDNAYALINVLAKELDALDQSYTRETEGQLVWDTGIGLLHLSQSDENKVDLSATCQTAANLYMLREAIYFRVQELKSLTSVELVWESAPDKPKTPPNFRMVELIEKTHIEPHYLRLRFQGESLEDYSKAGLHFRFLIAPKGRDPVWPTVNNEGRTDWPVGDDAFHMPAYTFRNINAQDGYFDVDIYLHGNGRTCSWAEDLKTGDIVGVVGPGGGWIPDAQSIFMAGDETALPAIARMIESYDETVSGLAFIETDGQAKTYLIDNRSNIQIVYFERKGGKSDLPALIQAANISPEDYDFAWIAGETKLAQFARGHLRDNQGFGRDNSYFAKYWQSVKQH